jgi:hypothetical protein
MLGFTETGLDLQQKTTDINPGLVQLISLDILPLAAGSCNCINMLQTIPPAVQSPVLDVHSTSFQESLRCVLGESIRLIVFRPHKLDRAMFHLKIMFSEKMTSMDMHGLRSGLCRMPLWLCCQP